MKINLNKTWSAVIDEVHRTKPRKSNLVEREKLFTLQILLGQYELAKKEKNKTLKKFYTNILETYESKHLHSR